MDDIYMELDKEFEDMVDSPEHEDVYSEREEVRSNLT
jgi:hypothetical protein